MKQQKYSRRNQQRPYGRQPVVNSAQANTEWTQQEQRAEMEQLRQEVSDLNEQLGWDRANAVCQENRRVEIEGQLNETMDQLHRQKTLKEMFINRGKETRAELERLEKYSDPETLSTARIATMVTNGIKRRKKKLLQKDYEELKVAYITSQEKFEDSLQEERNKNKLLEDELTRIRLHQVHVNEPDVLPARQQQPDALQLELQNEKMQRTILQNKFDELLKLHAESQEQLQLEKRRSKHLQENLEMVEASQQKMSQMHEAQIASIRQEAEATQHNFKREMEQNAVLQKDYVQLQKAYALSHNKFIAELQEQTSNNRHLQEKLKEMAVSKHEMHQWYEADISAAMRHVNSIQNELQKETEAHKATIAEGQIVINDMKAKEDRRCQDLKKSYEKQLKELTAQLNSQVKRSLDLSDEPEDDHPPQKRAWREERYRKPCQQEQSNVNVPAIECPEEAQMSEDEPGEPTPTEPTLTPPEQAEAPQDDLPQTPKSPSLWKKTRHFLGLRKKKRRDRE